MDTTLTVVGKEVKNHKHRKIQTAKSGLISCSQKTKLKSLIPNVSVGITTLNSVGVLMHPKDSNQRNIRNEITPQ